MVNDLILIMKEQVQCYDYLCGLSLEKKQSIITNNIDELQRLNELESRLICNNNTLEKKRANIINDIAYVLNIEPKHITISRLLDLIKGNNGYDNLLDVSNKMKDIIERLKESNKQNKLLIDSSLEFIDYSLNAIKSIERISYINSREDELNSVSMFDAKQ